MTVTTAPFQTLGSFNLGTGPGAVMGQGTEPELWGLWSFSNVQTDPPVWVSLEPTRVRDFNISRGRESEMQDFDAGTATITLDNRDRVFDPLYASGTYYPNVRPRNRVWLRAQWNGSTFDLFKGYVDAYQQVQPAPGESDMVAVVSASDELKLLNLRKTEAFDPPDAADYTGVIGTDNPSHVWQWRDPFLTTTTIVTTYNDDFPLFQWGPEDPYGSIKGSPEQTATVEGAGWRVTGSGYGQSTDTPLRGLDAANFDSLNVYGCLLLQFSGTANQLTSTDQSAGDMVQDTKGTVELWFKKTANPGSTGLFWQSPDVTGVADSPWQFLLTTTGTIQFRTRVAGAVVLTSTSGVLNNDTWYHLAGVRDGTNQILYVNGVNVASAASTAAWEQVSATNLMKVTNPGTGVTISLAEMAVYPAIGLSAARVQARYTAATQCGFVTEKTGLRVNDALDMVQNHAPRSVQTGGRNMTAAFSANQPVLNHARAATACEKPDGMFFTDAGGRLTFLGADHRTKSPYNTIQITFGDEGGGHVPYMDFDTDYSDSWIANIWNVSKARAGAIVQTVTDTTSVSQYDEISQSVTDLPLTLNADAATIAAAYLAKYKNPITRGNRLTLSAGDVTCTDAFLNLELGERVRVIRTLRSLGWFDQELFVQKMEVTGSNDQTPWMMSLNVSPL